MVAGSLFAFTISMTIPSSPRASSFFTCYNVLSTSLPSTERYSSPVLVMISIMLSSWRPSSVLITDHSISLSAGICAFPPCWSLMALFIVDVVSCSSFTNNFSSLPQQFFHDWLQFLLFALFSSCFLHSTITDDCHDALSSTSSFSNLFQAGAHLSSAVNIACLPLVLFV